jgi:hypothetical protein
LNIYVYYHEVRNNEHQNVVPYNDPRSSLVLTSAVTERSGILLRTQHIEFSIATQIYDMQVTVVLVYLRGLVEAVPYRPEGLRFDSQWGHWDFSLT